MPLIKCLLCFLYSPFFARSGGEALMAGPFFVKFLLRKIGKQASDRGWHADSDRPSKRLRLAEWRGRDRIRLWPPRHRSDYSAEIPSHQHQTILPAMPPSSDSR